MFSKFHFSNIEPCPCNSGKLFKDCCKKKAPRRFHNINETLHHTGQMMKKSRVKFCLYEGCKAKDIKKAHALQENRILNKLAVNKEVLMQDFTKDPIICEISPGKPEPFYFLTEVPISRATTATCYCGTHDDALFANIEKTQFTLETLDAEQLFLFAYKTFSFEFYTEIVTKRFYGLMFSTVPQIAKTPMSVYQYRNNELKLIDLQYYKRYFDTALQEKDFSCLETIVIEIPFRIQFANYMTVSPPFDIKGKRIRTLDKKTKRLKFVFFTSFPIEIKSYILISVLKEDLDVFKDYFNQIRQAPLGLMQYYINVFIPLYSQNLILSPRLWDSWTEKAQCGIQAAVADPQSGNWLMSLKLYLQNIEKAGKKDKIDTTKIDFNFFIPQQN